MTFRVGQMVVCVNDQNWANPGDGCHCPTRGSLYTIRAVIGDMVLLREIVNEPRLYIDGWHEGRFFAHRFSPIVSENKHIASFKRMLRNRKEKNQAELDALKRKKDPVPEPYDEVPFSG